MTDMKEAAPNREVVLGSSADADTQRGSVDACAGQATDPAILRDRIMNPCIAKSEAEWWAQRCIADLTEQLTVARAALVLTGTLVGLGRVEDSPFIADIEAAILRATPANSVGTNDRNAGGSENQ